MLGRMWRKGNPRALEMEIDAATMENSIEASQKTIDKNRTTI